MRRILVAVPASLALVLAVPGVALAHHGRHHHAASHFSSHHRHGKHAHLLRFGSARTATSPTTPTTPTEENAGTVESFENGVLTIKLADGSFVKGKVTENTDLQCVPATPPSGTNGDGDDQGDGGDQGDQGSSSSGDHAFSSGDRAHESDFQNQDGNSQGDDDENPQSTCTTELLKQGAMVRAAELEMNGPSSVWERIVLVH